MTARRTIALTAALAALTTSACASSDDPTTATIAATATTSPASTTLPPATSTPTDGETAAPATVSTAVAGTSASTATGPAVDAGADDVVVIRFTSGATTVDVTITDDNATTRDLLSMLPVTLRFEELNGREKISYLPRSLDTTDVPGSDPEDGDLIYYAPWGNLGFYYNAAGIGFDDDVIHIGTYNATPQQLTQLEGSDVSVDVAE